MCSNGISDDDPCIGKRSSIEELHKMDKIDERLIAIHQFLIHHNFQYTAENLLREAVRIGYTDLEKYSNMDNVYATDLCEQILLCYRSDDRKKFFKLWKNLIPESIKSSKEYKTLTLYLHVHFAILPKRIWLLYRRNTDGDSEVIHTATPETEINQSVNEGMKDLLKFLISEGKELENEPNLRLFFALPYIEDPLKEPSFSKIFDKRWLDELTMKLEIFLLKHKQYFVESSINKKSEIVSDSYISSKTEGKNGMEIIPNDRDIPFLEEYGIEDQFGIHYDTDSEKRARGTQTYFYDIQIPYDDLQSSNIYQELTLTKSHLYDMQSNYAKLNSKYHRLHTDYHKLISVAGELTTVLDNLYRGQPVDLQKTLESCIRIFPDLFNQNAKDDRYDNERETKRISSLEINRDSSVSRSKLYNHSSMHCLTGSKKQIRHLVKESDNSKIRLHESDIQHLDETDLIEAKMRYEKSVQALGFNFDEYKNSYDLVHLYAARSSKCVTSAYKFLDELLIGNSI